MSTLSRIACASVAALALSISLPADAKFVFPYNHPDLEWFTIETEHFFVHYPVSKRPDRTHFLVDPTWSARKCAKVAEEMWAPMTEEFDYPLQEKIHIVLLDQSDDLEGFTIPSWDWTSISQSAATPPRLPSIWNTVSGLVPPGGDRSRRLSSVLLRRTP